MSDVDETLTAFLCPEIIFATETNGEPLHPSGHIYAVGLLDDVDTKLFTSFDAGKTWRQSARGYVSLSIDSIGDEACG